MFKELKYIIFHPEDGFSVLHHKKSGSVIIAALSALMWFLATLLARQYTSFRFNENNTNSFNVFYILLGTVGIFVAFAVANWAVCTLFDGEGSFREIFIVCGYAIIPYWFFQIVGLIFSHVLSLQESIVMTTFTVIGILYTLFLLFVGFIQIHDYSFSKTLFSVIATVVGVFLIIFVIFLGVMLVQELSYFIGSVIKECMMRSFT